MSDDPSHRLDELKLLWESDPSSKVYLQLASVYRQKGQLDKAVEVLETSLQHRPRDPRGRVALARCRLELGEHAAAAELLEEVIRQDAAHVEANKQLLECYLQLGDAVKAEERLGIYRLLNDRDPELDHLEYRLSSLGQGGDGEVVPVSGASPVGALEGSDFEPVAATPGPEVPATPELVAPQVLTPVPIAPEASAPAPAGEAAEEPAAMAQESLSPMQTSPEPILSEPLVPVVSAAEPAAPGPAAPELAASELAAPEPDTSEPADPGPEVSAGASGDFELFELPAQPEPVDHDPWGGDLFDLAPPAAAPVDDLGSLWEQTEIVDLDDEKDDDAGGEDQLDEVESVEELAFTDDLAFEDSVEEGVSSSVEAPVDEAPGSTATLGLLYLKQGHLDEAEAILRRVLARDPHSEAALAGLQQLEAQRSAGAVSMAAEGEIEEPEEPDLAADLAEPEAFAAAEDVVAADDFGDAEATEAPAGSRPEDPAELAEEISLAEEELEAEAEPEETIEAEAIQTIEAEAIQTIEAEAIQTIEAEAIQTIEAEAIAEEIVAPAQAESAIPSTLSGRALLGRVALTGGMPADQAGRKIAVLEQYIQHIRTASGDHVH